MNTYRSTLILPSITSEFGQLNLAARTQKAKLAFLISVPQRPQSIPKQSVWIDMYKLTMYRCRSTTEIWRKRKWL